MKKYFWPTVDFVRFHKMKIFFTSIMTFVFLLLFFPKEDLSAFISESIKKYSGNSMSVNFENIDFDIIPSPKN